MSLLTIDNVTKTFRSKGFFGQVKEVRALDGVSLSVEKGESIGIVGESGCGKSTLANLIVRLEEPTSGRILLDGTDISHMKEDGLRPLRRRIQIVFQDPYSSLSPRMTIGDIVAEPMRVLGGHSAGEIEARARELLHMVGLSPGAMRRYPHEFSGGQRQRISIARALMTAPEILILDEPTSALDVSVQAQVLNLLTDLRQELHLTYLFISHNLAVVKYISDKTVVMRKGRIVETGPSERILSAPSEAYTRELIEAVPMIGKPFRMPDGLAEEAGGAS